MDYQIAEHCLLLREKKRHSTIGLEYNVKLKWFSLANI